MPPTPSLRRVLLDGTFWTAAGMYGSGLISVAITAVLARLLAPQDFGVLAAVAAIAAFFAVVAEIAVGSAIVQRADLTHRELSSIFWFSVGAAAVVYAVLVLTSGLIARALDTPAVATVLPIAGVIVILHALLVVPLALLRRDLRFRIVALSQTAATIGAGAIAVLMAIVGFGYGAVVGQYVAVTALQLAIIWAASRWLPATSFRFADLRKIFDYSAALLGHVVVNHWARSADTFLLARYLGADVLGYYALAQRLVAAPMQLVGNGMRPLLHPAMVRMADDEERFRRGFVDLLRIASLFTFTIAAIIAVTAQPLVAIVWGRGWEPTVPIARAMALFVAVQPLTALAGAVFMARNATVLMFRFSIAGAIVTVAGLLIGLRFGAEGVAWGGSIAYAVLVPLVTCIAYSRVLHGAVRDLAAPFGVAVLGGAVTFGSGVAIDSLLQPETANIVRLLGVGAAAGGAAAAFIWLAASDLLLELMRRPRPRNDLASSTPHERIGHEERDRE